MTALAERLAAVMALDADAPALEFEGQWSTWGDLSAAAAEIDRVLAGLGLGAGAPVGLMLRNRPAALGAFLGLLRAGACVVTVNPMLGAERLRADLPGLGLPLLVGEADDLALVPPAVLPATARGALGRLGAPIDLTAATEGPSVADAGAGRRRAHAHQRHHRPAQAHRPPLRDARAGHARGEALRDGHAATTSGSAPASSSSTRRSCT